MFIGIESTDPVSLKETLKAQNLHEDILTSVRRICSYGVDVLGGVPDVPQVQNVLFDDSMYNELLAPTDTQPSDHDEP